MSTRFAASAALVLCVLSSTSLFACGAPDTEPRQMDAPDGGCCSDLHSTRAQFPSCDPEWDPDCGATDGGGGGGGTTDPAACPGWSIYSAQAPCLVETYTGYTATHYCEISSTSTCAAIRRYYVRTTGECFGMERLVGESIPACLGY
jgi:hypothetical protein